MKLNDSFRLYTLSYYNAIELQLNRIISNNKYIYTKQPSRFVDACKKIMNKPTVSTKTTVKTIFFLDVLTYVRTKCQIDWDLGSVNRFFHIKRMNW